MTGYQLEGIIKVNLWNVGYSFKSTTFHYRIFVNNPRDSKFSEGGKYRFLFPVRRTAKQTISDWIKVVLNCSNIHFAYCSKPPNWNNK